jgi:hypothetical protein
MKAILVDFASQNQPKWPSFKIFLGGVSRQGSFETATKGIFGRTVSLRPTVRPSQSRAATAKRIGKFF